MIHQLKTWPAHFDEVWNGKKTFEKRVNDRDYKVGDSLLLKRYDPTIGDGVYDSRSILCRVTHILKGPEMGVTAGECIMSIQDVINNDGVKKLQDR